MNFTYSKQITKCTQPTNVPRHTSSKMSLSTLYLKITPLFYSLPPLTYMIMCKNAIAACNDKNVWIQSVYIFPPSTKKLAFSLNAFQNSPGVEKTFVCEWCSQDLEVQFT